MLPYDKISKIEAAVRSMDKDAAERINAEKYLNLLSAKEWLGIEVNEASTTREVSV